MISSSQVNSASTSSKNLFEKYEESETNLEPKTVWEGASQKNAIEQMNKFVSEFSEPIESQFKDFASAADKYKEWETAKKNLETAERDLDAAQRAKTQNPQMTIDLSSYTRKVTDAKTAKTDLEKEINDLLKNVKSEKIDISAATVKTPDSYKMYDFVNFYQYNYKQGYGDGTIASCGCGPTAMAMVLTYLLGETVDPVETSNWSMAHNGYCPGEGTYWSFFPAISKAYDVECNQMSASTGNIIDQLKKGKTVITIMGPGHFTNGGHFIVLRGLTSDGRVIVADPNSETRSQQTWDPGLISSEASQLWAFDADQTAEMTI